MADDVVISVRTRGTRKSSRDVDGVTSSVTRLDRAGRTAGAGLGVLGSGARSAASGGLSTLTRQAGYASAAVAGIGVLSARAGLQFNASMEQNEIAFTHFLGSSQAARRELAYLYDLAKVTPFQFTDLTLATRKFMAFGFGVKESNALLTTMADTASGLALDDSGIDRMVLAIGQIKSKGTLQMEDLRQLQELGAVNMPELRKALGLTADEMANIGAEHVSSTKALRVLKAQWDDTFGGMSQKQAKSFSGQVSTLKDNLNQTLGAISKPGFDILRKDVFPALNKGAEDVNSIFKRTDIDTGEKLSLSHRALSKRFDPLVDAAKEAFDDAEVGDWVSRKVEEGTPKVLDAAGELGKDAVVALAKGWWEAGIWGKLITAGFLGSKLGLIGPAAGSVFGWAGKKAAGQFRSSWRKRIGRLPSPVITGPGFVAGPGASAAGGAAGGAAARGAAAGGAGGAIAKWGLKGARIAGPLAVVGDALVNADTAGEGSDDFQGAVRRARAAGERKRRRSRVARPRGRGDVIEIHQTTVVDGKVVEKVVRRVQADRKARG